MPSHNHNAASSTSGITGKARLSADYQNTCTGVFSCDTSLGNNGRGSTSGDNTTLKINASFSTSTTTSAKGGGQAHNIIQPYISVYIWKRVS